MLSCLCSACYGRSPRNSDTERGRSPGADEAIAQPSTRQATWTPEVGTGTGTGDLASIPSECTAPVPFAPAEAPLSTASRSEASPFSTAHQRSAVSTERAASTPNPAAQARSPKAQSSSPLISYPSYSSHDIEEAPAGGQGRTPHPPSDKEPLPSAPSDPQRTPSQIQPAPFSSSAMTAIASLPVPNPLYLIQQATSSSQSVGVGTTTASLATLPANLPPSPFCAVATARSEAGTEATARFPGDLSAVPGPSASETSTTRLMDYLSPDSVDHTTTAATIMATANSSVLSRPVVGPAAGGLQANPALGSGRRSSVARAGPGAGGFSLFGALQAFVEHTHVGEANASNAPSVASTAGGSSRTSGPATHSHSQVPQAPQAMAPGQRKTSISSGDFFRGFDHEGATAGGRDLPTARLDQLRSANSGPAPCVSPGSDRSRTRRRTGGPSSDPPLPPSPLGPTSSNGGTGRAQTSPARSLPGTGTSVAWGNEAAPGSETGLAEGIIMGSVHLGSASSLANMQDKPPELTRAEVTVDAHALGAGSDLHSGSGARHLPGGGGGGLTRALSGPHSFDGMASLLSGTENLYFCVDDPWLAPGTGVGGAAREGVGSDTDNTSRTDNAVSLFGGTGRAGGGWARGGRAGATGNPSAGARLQRTAERREFLSAARCINAVLQDVQVLSLLGAGAHGKVYKGALRDRFVAVKVIIHEAEVTPIIPRTALPGGMRHAPSNASLGVAGSSGMPSGSYPPASEQASRLGSGSDGRAGGGAAAAIAAAGINLLPGGLVSGYQKYSTSGSGARPAMHTLRYQRAGSSNMHSLPLSLPGGTEGGAQASEGPLPLLWLPGMAPVVMPHKHMLEGLISASAQHPNIVETYRIVTQLLSSPSMPAFVVTRGSNTPLWETTQLPGTAALGLANASLGGGTGGGAGTVHLGSSPSGMSAGGSGGAPGLSGTPTSRQHVWLKRASSLGPNRDRAAPAAMAVQGALSTFANATAEGGGVRRSPSALFSQEALVSSSGNGVVAGGGDSGSQPGASSNVADGEVSATAAARILTRKGSGGSGAASDGKFTSSGTDSGKAFSSSGLVAAANGSATPAGAIGLEAGTGSERAAGESERQGGAGDGNPEGGYRVMDPRLLGYLSAGAPGLVGGPAGQPLAPLLEEDAEGHGASGNIAARVSDGSPSLHDGVHSSTAHSPHHGSTTNSVATAGPTGAGTSTPAGILLPLREGSTLSVSALVRRVGSSDRNSENHGGGGGGSNPGDDATSWRGSGQGLAQSPQARVPGRRSIDFDPWVSPLSGGAARLSPVRPRTCTDDGMPRSAVSDSDLHPLLPPPPSPPTEQPLQNQLQPQRSADSPVARVVAVGWRPLGSELTPGSLDVQPGRGGGATREPGGAAAASSGVTRYNVRRTAFVGAAAALVPQRCSSPGGGGADTGSGADQDSAELILDLLGQQAAAQRSASFLMRQLQQQVQVQQQQQHLIFQQSPSPQDPDAAGGDTDDGSGRRPPPALALTPPAVPPAPPAIAPHAAAAGGVPWCVSTDSEAGVPGAGAGRAGVPSELVPGERPGHAEDRLSETPYSDLPLPGYEDCTEVDENGATVGPSYPFGLSTALFSSYHASMDQGSVSGMPPSSPSPVPPFRVQELRGTAPAATSAGGSGAGAGGGSVSGGSGGGKASSVPPAHPRPAAPRLDSSPTCESGAWLPCVEPSLTLPPPLPVGLPGISGVLPPVSTGAGGPTLPPATTGNPTWLPTIDELTAGVVSPNAPPHTAAAPSGTRSSASSNIRQSLQQAASAGSGEHLIRTSNGSAASGPSAAYRAAAAAAAAAVASSAVSGGGGQLFGGQLMPAEVHYDKLSWSNHTHTSASTNMLLNSGFTALLASINTAGGSNQGNGQASVGALGGRPHVLESPGLLGSASRRTGNTATGVDTLVSNDTDAVTSGLGLGLGLVPPTAGAAYDPPGRSHGRGSSTLNAAPGDPDLRPLTVESTALSRSFTDARSSRTSRGRAARRTAGAGGMGMGAGGGGAAGGVPWAGPPVRPGHERWQVLIVQELCTRGNLKDAIVSGVFHAANVAAGTQVIAMRQLLDTAAEIASAMAYLHIRAIVHGDLKTANVLLQRDDSDPRGFIAKLADFGLARQLGTRGAEDGLLVSRIGTVTHMAPETIRDNRVLLSSDVYSFGVIMWELYCAQQPFANYSAFQLLSAVVQYDERPQFPVHCPPAYGALAVRCMAKNPGDRPSFTQVHKELVSIRDGLFGGSGQGTITVPLTQARSEATRILQSHLQIVSGSVTGPGGGASSTLRDGGTQDSNVMSSLESWDVYSRPTTRRRE